uniref:BPI2 domain-containing protein n=1 Tax=Trichuris muris TaxID=70415 RepID=A0A5S6QF51_TRIMR
MLLMHFLLFSTFVLCVGFVGGVERSNERINPGVVLRLNKPGVQYLECQFRQLLKDRIASIDWNNAVKTMLLPSFPLLEARLIDLRPPRFDDFKILPLSRLYFSLSQMDLVLFLEERFQLLSLLRPGISVLAALKSLGLEVSIEVLFSEDTKTVSLVMDECNVTFGWSRLKFVNVDLFGDILNSMNRTMSSLLQAGAQKRICAQIEQFVDNTLSNYLETAPRKFSIAQAISDHSTTSTASTLPLLPGDKANLLRELMVDLSLVRAPLLNEKAVVTMHSGEVSWKGQGKTPFLATALYSSLESNNRMASIFLSDYVFNSLMYALWDRRFFNFVLSEQNSALMELLQSTDCPFELCIPDLLELMGIDIDFESRLELAMTLIAPPNVSFSDNFGMVASKGKISLNSVGPQGQSNVFKVNVHAVAAFRLFIQKDMTLKGKVAIDRLLMTTDKSSKATLNDRELELFASIAKTVLGVVGTELLDQGIVLPSMPGFTIKNGLLHFVGNSMKADFDFGITENLLAKFGTHFSQVERRSSYKEV